MRSVHQHIALLCKASGEEISGYSMGSIVDFLRIAILMAHPVLAMMLIWAFMRQRSWRHQKIDIEEKDMALRMYEEIEIEMSGQSIHGDNLNYSLHHMYLFQTRPCLSLALENSSWCPYQLKRTGLTKSMML